MTQNNNLLLAFYGDDFTGSTDALEVLSRAGIKTVLFIEPPGAEQLRRYENLQAVGVAGRSRAMPPVKMEQELTSVFSALQALKPRHVHYKVCSTFDSSPAIGSIGKAIDVGFDIFGPPFVPLLVAAPSLGRHCVFGNLFAKMGIGSDGAIYRLDRHPSMRQHPTTPADESDLRLHLEKQTTKKVGLVDVLQISQPKEVAQAQIEKEISMERQVILFDGLYQEQMPYIGKLIDQYAGGQQSLFSVGSSGIETALTGFWQDQGIISATEDFADCELSGPLLVASGSCSPVTARQISYALEMGFKDIALDTEQLLQEDLAEDLLESYAARAADYMAAGFDVIMHTSRGAADSRVSRTEEVFRAKGIQKSDTALLYGTMLGRIVRLAAQKADVQRIIIAGGDTSSYAARAMGIESVEMIAPFAPGAPLCRAHAPGSAVDGKQLNFKGGQVGKEDYFLTGKAQK